MTNPKTKQLKINRLFKKRADIDTEDCSELEEEIQQLEIRLKERRMELFEISKQSLKRKVGTLKLRKTQEFVKPELIVQKNDIDHMKMTLELYGMLTGMEVRGYVPGEHCCVMYLMQHHLQHDTQHGLRISLANGQNELENFSLPPGFPYKSILDDYDKISRPECLGAIRKGLVAFYDRKEQFNKLREVVSYYGQLFEKMDGSYMEVSLSIQSTEKIDAPPVNILLMLVYRVYDVRPKHYDFGKNTDLPEVEIEKLYKQCAIFKQKPLDVAFRECFIEGPGPYKLNAAEYLEKEREQ